MARGQLLSVAVVSELEMNGPHEKLRYTLARDALAVARRGAIAAAADHRGNSADGEKGQSADAIIQRMHESRAVYQVPHPSWPDCASRAFRTR